MKAPSNNRPPCRGFSLIEMVGVIAIMAIVAALITPNLARQISRSNGDKEDQALKIIADGLIRSVRATQTIPGANSWVTNVAAQIGMSANDVRYVNPSDTASGRVYLLHPSFVPTNSSTSDPLWSQSTSGAASVTNARLIILSTHKSSLSLPVSSGRAASTTAFENIWDWSYDATTKAPPAGWSGSWSDNGEYLHIQRINLAPLFQIATFNNAHHGTNYPYFQMGSLTATDMTSTNVVSAYFIDGTIIRLYFTNGTTLQMTHTLGDGVNFVYESSRWRIP